HAKKVRSKQRAKAADFSEYLRAVSLLYERLNLAFELVAKIEINAGARVCLPSRCHPERMRRISQVTVDAMSKEDCLRTPFCLCEVPRFAWNDTSILLQICEQRRVRFLLGEGCGALFAFFHDELVQRGIDWQGIITCKTGETKTVQRLPGSAHHA